jgi:hypothetical protein
MLITVGLLLITTVGMGRSGDLLPADAKLNGQSQTELSISWWKWAASFEYDDSPIADRTGEKCGLKQRDQVWFLAGTYGSARTERTCTIPHGRYLFFPLINYVVAPCSSAQPCESAPTCESVTDLARETTENPASLILDIDGKRYSGLDRHRQASSGCFDMAAQTDGSFHIYPSASNGYYILLAPLSPGRHVINFGGVLPGLVQAVTYTLIVN